MAGLFGLLPQGAFQLPNAMGYDAPTGDAMMPGFPDSPMNANMDRRGIGIPGLLGIKGGFRDALGSIGDALLIANNAEPMYAPEKERREMQGIMQRYEQDPEGTIAAVRERNPVMAQKLEEAMFKRQKAGVEQLEARNERADRLIPYVQMGIQNPAAWPKIREAIMKTGAELPFDLPENATPEQLEAILSGYLGPKEVRDDQRADRNTDSMIANRENMIRNRDANTASMVDTRTNQSVNRDRDTESKVRRRSAQNVADTIKAGAYADKETRTPSKKSSKADKLDLPTIKESKIPPSARRGTYKGRKVAKIGEKIYYVD